MSPVEIANKCRALGCSSSPVAKRRRSEQVASDVRVVTPLEEGANMRNEHGQAKKDVLAVGEPTDGENGNATPVILLEQTKNNKAWADVTKKTNATTPPLTVETLPEETQNYRFLRLLPYETEFSTFAKRRWLDREILEVFTKEFTKFDKQHFEERLQSGGILVKSKGKTDTPRPVDATYRIKDGDFITHKVVMEENLILNQPIEIVSETEDLLVVNKPASVPVHPGGSYKHFTVTGLLAAGRFTEQGGVGSTRNSSSRVTCSPSTASNSPSVFLSESKSECVAKVGEKDESNIHIAGAGRDSDDSKQQDVTSQRQVHAELAESSPPFLTSNSRFRNMTLHTSHRLDRFTSGLVLLAKTRERARQLQTEFVNDKIQKTYFAVAEGNLIQTLLEAESNKNARTNLVPACYDPSDVTVVVPGGGRGPQASAGGDGNTKISPMIDFDGLGENNLHCLVHGGITCVNHKLGEHAFRRMARPEEKEDEVTVTARKKRKHQESLLSRSTSATTNVVASNPPAPESSTCSSTDTHGKPEAQQVEEPAKWSETYFYPVFYDKAQNTTLVIAKPKTGRTHQIRIHLQVLGHPIVNDPCYNEAYHKRRKGTKNGSSCSATAGADGAEAAAVTEKNSAFTVKNTTSEHSGRDECVCDEDVDTSSAVDAEYQQLRSDYPLFPGGHYSGIFLHAVEYKGPDWAYRTAVPEWAKSFSTERVDEDGLVRAL
ncbi:unnamed protein product [Amoebophrya sp. A120]|nr:unnamed protein product [Amoebophrya sp. A120]|eukprot:GSA120T00024665001.1